MSKAPALLWTFGEPVPKEILDRNGIKQVYEMLPVRKGKRKSYAMNGRPNPCVTMWGNGPENSTCKDCVHLIRKRLGKTYIKCDLRGNTGGPGTDHFASWPACAKWSGKTE